MRRPYSAEPRSNLTPPVEKPPPPNGLMSYFPFPGGSNFFGNMNAGIGWGLAAAADVQIAFLIFNVFFSATVALACLYAVPSQRVT